MILDPRALLGMEAQLHVQSQQWVPCPHPGPILHSVAAGGRSSGHADQPFCGVCAAGGTSSLGP